MKLNGAGAIQWQQCYGGPWDDGATMIHQTSDGGYILTGHSMLTGGDVSANHGGHDYWVVKLNAAVGINELTNTNTITIFPNPASDVINVYATNVRPGTAFFIIDPSGKIVLTGKLINETTTISIAELMPGAYIFQVGEQRKQLVKIIKK